MFAEVQLQGDFPNEGAWGTFSKSRAQFTEVFQTNVNKKMHNITIRWFQFGDTCSKTFFNYHKGGHRKVFIKKLIADGKILTIQVEFNEYVWKF